MATSSVSDPSFSMAKCLIGSADKSHPPLSVSQAEFARRASGIGRLLLVERGPVAGEGVGADAGQSGKTEILGPERLANNAAEETVLVSLVGEVQFGVPDGQLLEHRRNGVGTVGDSPKKRTSLLRPTSAMAIAIVALWTSSPT
jgi:hypothetical protein